MAISPEICDNNFANYCNVLKKARILELEHPESIYGYNALIELAEEYYERAQSAGGKKLPPLPPYKTAK